METEELDEEGEPTENYTPYSLGKLIEWKPSSLTSQIPHGIRFDTPYSLGKLIEWKQSDVA